jgi:hypothetical protein
MEELEEYNKAMELNSQLKERYAGQVDGEDDSIDAFYKEQQRTRRINPTIKQKLPSEAAGVPSSKPDGKNRGFIRKKRDFTFDDMKKMDIDMENQSILERMNRVSLRNNGRQIAQSAKTYKPKVSSHTVNRRKKLSDQAQENLAFLKRLNNIKPTYSKQKAKKQHQHDRKVLKLRQQYQQVQVRSKPRPEWQDTVGDSKNYSSRTGLGPSSLRSPRQRR